MKRSELAWLLLCLLLFAVLGYLREFFFVNLNVILYMKYYGSQPVQPIPLVMQPFTHYSYAWLYYSKYFFTFFWTCLFYLLSRFCLRRVTAERIFLRLLNWAYVVMLTISALSMLYGLVVLSRLDRDEYTLSRWLMGIAQSPIICLILLASEKLHKTSRNP